MMPYRLYHRAIIPARLDVVFAFFADAENLGRITPPEMHFRIQTPQPIEMRAGTLIDYTIRLWGIPLKWRTKIALWNPPNRFVDEQLSGPYRTWIHTHRFEGIGDDTLMEDEVVYALPFGLLGRLVAPIVRRQLDRIFAYRESAVRKTFAH